MKKSILSVLVCLIALALRSQTTMDTLINGGNPAGQLDTNHCGDIGLPPDCWLPECDQIESTGWVLPLTALDTVDSSWCGTVYLMASRAAVYNVQVWQEERWILYDTCAYLQADPVVNIAFLRFRFPAHCTVVVSGQYGDTICAYGKGSYGVPFPRLDTQLVDMDTLCGLVAVAQPIQHDYLYREMWPPYTVVVEPAKGVMYMRDGKLVVVY